MKKDKSKKVITIFVIFFMFWSHGDLSFYERQKVQFTV